MLEHEAQEPSHSPSTHSSLVTASLFEWSASAGEWAERGEEGKSIRGVSEKSGGKKMGKELGICFAIVL